MPGSADSPPRLIADAMLGKLAKWLRLLGCDVVYYRGLRRRQFDAGARAVRLRRILRSPHTPRSNGPSPILALPPSGDGASPPSSRSPRSLGVHERKIEDIALIEKAEREDRLILTRNARLIRRRWKRPVAFLFIRDDHLPRQLRQAVLELRLSVADHLFTRCLECNRLLEAMPRERVEGRVPAYVYEHQTRFSGCPECRRIYWPGTHWEHVHKRLAGIFPESGDPSLRHSG